MMQNSNFEEFDDLSLPGEINVTPMVDVMLVLLVIFMVTAPMLATGLKVDLPKSGAAQTLALKQPIIVGISPEGAVMVGSTNTTPEDLVATLDSMTGGDKERSIQLRGDETARYGRFVDVLGRLSSGGYGNIAIEAKAEKAGDSSGNQPTQLTP